MKKYLLTCLPFLAIFSVSVFLVVSLSACQNKTAGNVTINDLYSMSYEFSEKPKIGSSTLKVTVFDKKGDKSTDLTVMVGYDMPSMRGHHGFGPAQIAPNKNNVYLTPVEFVMPGKWEITLIFSKDNRVLRAETITTDI